MVSFLSFFVTPALVSLIVTLWAGRVMEAQRARRDNFTKLFEASREDVRRAADAAVDYFAAAPPDRTALQEAKVVAADRELRQLLPLVLETPDSDNRFEIQQRDANDAFTALIAELTGGNFQVAEGEVDREHIRRLVHAGARMRAALARLRDSQLQESAKSDMVLKGVESARRRWRNRKVGQLPPAP